MSLLPPSASFEERVEQLFVAYRGRGVALCALDADLVHAWAQHAVPLEVIARGLRTAAERAGWDARDDASVRFLGATRRAVETEIRRYLKTTEGKGAAPDPLARYLEQKHKLFQELASSIAEALAPRRSLPLERLAAATGTFSDFENAARTESLALALAVRALPWAERRALYRQASCESEGASSPRARVEKRRFSLTLLLRRALCL